MIQLFISLLVILAPAYSYVPTVESLFRNGSNADVEVNGSSVTLSVKKIETLAPRSTSATDVSLLSRTKIEDFYKIFFTSVSNESTKVAQTRYKDKTFSEASLEQKIYYPNFTPLTIKPEQAERGVFFGVIESLVMNNGYFLISFLKNQGVPVMLNQDLINREKVDYLASYKRYLLAISKDRSKRNDPNPLRPDDSAAREKIEKVMNDSMYLDTNQVKLSREYGQMAWLVSAGPFEAVISYRERQLQRVKYKSAMGEMEIVFKDYWLASGTHYLPRMMIVKDFKGETYQIEFTNLRHYVEKDEDLVRRLTKWDSILKGKESSEPRPEFLL